MPRQATLSSREDTIPSQNKPSDTVTRPRDGRARGKSEHFFDFSLLFIVLFLVGFGCVLLYSTSSYKATTEYGDSTYYLYKQIRSILFGLVLMTLLIIIPYRWWEHVYILGYAVAIGMLALIPVFGHTAGGAKRWFHIGSLSIQPAEIAKLALILTMAVFITRIGKKRLRTWGGILVAMLPSLPIAALLYLVTSDLSSAVIVIAIAVIMVFVASPDYKRFILMAVAAALLITILVVWVVRTGSGGFRGNRVLAWLDPVAAGDDGYQTLQALYAIGSGGMMGKGLGQSMQKLGFVPEAANDMIFSIICEELGVFGAVAIVLMFVMLIWRLMMIAANAEDMFGSLLVVGIMGQLATQVIFNIAVVTNLIPNTGISLPFISYGGTAILTQLAEIGLALGVGRHIVLES